VIAGFGWGKPVPVNVYALRPGRAGMALVAAAGPIANVIVAVAAAVLYRVMAPLGVAEFALDLVWYVVLYNLLLAAFNFIPIPPLDGYNVVLAFLPPRIAFTVQRYAPYGVILLLVLIVLPSSPLSVFFGWVGAATQALTGA
jgi:Zn-dependent protease